MLLLTFLPGPGLAIFAHFLAGLCRSEPVSCDNLALVFRTHRWAKKWTCSAKQQPGNARQKILATKGPCALFSQSLLAD